VVGAEERLARAPAEEEGVGGTEQAGWGHGRGDWVSGELELPVGAGFEQRRDGVQPGADVAEGEPGPFDEVALVSGSVARGVAPYEFREGPGALDGRWGWPSQSRTRTYACWFSCIGPRTMSPCREARARRCTSAWPPNHL
jgi:hypothetical protein